MIINRSKMSIYKKLIILLIFIFTLLFLTGCQKNKNNLTKISFYQDNKKIITIKAEIAETSQELSKGLMFREKLGEKRGMLFKFKDEKIRSFWMKNMKIPLDIIFVSKDLKIVSCLEELQPCLKNPCTYYLSEKPAMYAIEVNAGFVDKYKVDKKNIKIKIH